MFCTAVVPVSNVLYRTCTSLGGNVLYRSCIRCRHLGGPALKYFYMIHRGGRTSWPCKQPKTKKMARNKVQTSEVWKCLIFPDLAGFRGETGFMTQKNVADRRDWRSLPSLGRTQSDPVRVGNTSHNVCGLACILGLTNSHSQSLWLPRNVAPGEWCPPTIPFFLERHQVIPVPSK